MTHAEKIAAARLAIRHLDYRLRMLNKQYKMQKGAASALATLNDIEEKYTHLSAQMTEAEIKRIENDGENLSDLESFLRYRDSFIEQHALFIEKIGSKTALMKEVAELQDLADKEQERSKARRLQKSAEKKAEAEIKKAEKKAAREALKLQKAEERAREMIKKQEQRIAEQKTKLEEKLAALKAPADANAAKNASKPAAPAPARKKA